MSKTVQKLHLKMTNKTPLHKCPKKNKLTLVIKLTVSGPSLRIRFSKLLANRVANSSSVSPNQIKSTFIGSVNNGPKF